MKEKVIRKQIRLEDDPDESNLIVVHNLTRPFTVIQLKNMLNRTGQVQDFWIDRQGYIKHKVWSKIKYYLTKESFI